MCTMPNILLMGNEATVSINKCLMKLSKTANVLSLGFAHQIVTVIYRVSRKKVYIFPGIFG